MSQRIDASKIINSIETLKNACIGLANSVQKNILDNPDMPPLEAIQKVQNIQDKLMILLDNMETTSNNMLKKLQEGEPDKIAERANEMKKALNKFFQQMKTQLEEVLPPPPPPQETRMAQLFREPPLTKRKTKKGGRRKTRRRRNTRKNK
jgi:hypothetical protein